MNFRQISAVFVDGEQVQSGLANEGNVMAGGGRFGDECDEQGPGAGNGAGSSTGQGSTWEQSRERWGYRHGSEGFAAYSGAERFRIAALTREVRTACRGWSRFG